MHEEPDRHGMDVNASRRDSRRWRWLVPIVGFFALLWFLVRVVPKPSRATYPCQRAAFPLASSFVLWLAGSLVSIAALRKAKRCVERSRYVLCAVLLAAAGGATWGILSLTDETPLMADPPAPNSPMGTAKGLHPGRVAWVFDPDITDWDGGTGDGNWWYEHIDADVAGSMVSRAIRGYAGIDDERKAWDAIFHHFNVEKGRGDQGYAAGEKIAIKINLVACFAEPGSGRVDDNYDKTDAWNDNIDNAPELIHGLFDQLVHVVGVAQADITIGDPSGLFPNYMYDKLHPDFPDVHYMDNRGTLGRTRAEYSDHPFYWSKPGLGTVRQDYVPTAYAEATYFINLAILKSHDSGGITVCGKNHYGSLIRLPPGTYRDSAGVWHAAPTNPPYYAYHDDLPSSYNALGHYRNRVDFMGHADVGGKTFLYLIDGILAGWNWNAEPAPWTLPPFDKSDGWPCSLFASMDPVAIDSVALDFLLQQWPEHAGMAGTEDYLIEAALADDPPSGTFYDPNHPGEVSRLPSLGVHEHWNNALDKKYSRDLDPEGGTGIELLFVGDDSALVSETESAPMIDGAVDGAWGRTFWRFFPNLVDPLGGSRPDETDFSGRWKVLWDPLKIYFLVEVTDDVLVHSPAHDDTYWCDDNVEIFIDGDDSKGNGQAMPNYDGKNDFEFGFRWADPQVRLGAWSAQSTAGIVFSMVAAGDGYRLEAAIPWSTLRAQPGSLPAVGAGTQIGLDVHITDNDDLGDSDRDFKLAWQSRKDDTYQDASLLRTVSLGRDYGVAGTLLELGSSWRYHKGTSEASSPTTAWRAPTFDDSTWSEGPAPIGYGDPPYGTLLSDMRNSYTTVFLRSRFEVPEDLNVTSFALAANYDDGFIAWINGTEVARVNAPAGEPLRTSVAPTDHESGAVTRFSLPSPYDYIVKGENVIAVQCFNNALNSSDLKFDLTLSYRAQSAPTPLESFIRGDSNGDGTTDISDAVHTLLVLFTELIADDCEDARDVNDDGVVDLSDPVALLDFLFRGGDPPPEPSSAPGRDPTADDLGCTRRQ